ncbi:MAG TPA: aldehyde dehydrogenase family protein [Casimicrobiaceae bacterium]|nr:aldehyde dehydrogenase family protein [Casimicrobiaceae bacterium]
MNAPREIVDAARAALDALFAQQRDAFAREPYPDVRVRRDRLGRLLRIVEDEAAWVRAVDEDFGHRSAHETRLAELYVVGAEARFARRHLARWMRPRRVRTPVRLWPGAASIMPQPRGVAGVISPWNYPLQLALAPVVAALAAGNRVMLKPSELAPATSALLCARIAEHFAPDELAVVLGDAAIGEAFSRLPFDHLFFTGSTAVGRRVALAAAANLTPVALELGGKSPALFDADADFDRLAPRLMAGKLLNAGQTCIAPDYALVPRERVDAFVAAVQRATAALYPPASRARDYTAIVNARHHARLMALADDARAHGARIVPLGDVPGGHARHLAPALIVGVDERMAIMREEIFGPLLPVETYTDFDDALARINARPHPLALYWFGHDRSRLTRLLRETRAGGVTVNDTLWHFAHEGLPFGGVGASGNGAYHGEHGFRAFSLDKPVFVQRRVAPSRLLHPPYGAAFERLLTILKRL